MPRGRRSGRHRGEPRLVARPGPGRGARRRRHQRLPRRSRLQQARRERRPTRAACPRPARSTASWRATSSPARAPTTRSSASPAADPNAPVPTRGSSSPTRSTCRNRPPPATGYGMTLLLHSLGATYNQYLGSRNQSQFGERGSGSIVITPLARGPDGFYDGLAEADVFEVWADVARRYQLDPDVDRDHRLLDGRQSGRSSSPSSSPTCSRKRPADGRRERGHRACWRRCATSRC